MAAACFAGCLLSIICLGPLSSVIDSGLQVDCLTSMLPLHDLLPQVLGCFPTQTKSMAELHSQLTELAQNYEKLGLRDEVG